MEVPASDFSGQIITDINQRHQAVVQYPEHDPRVLDMTPDEFEQLGKLALSDPVLVSVKVPGEEGEVAETRQFILTKANFAKLVTRASVEQVLDDAKGLVTYEPPAPRRERTTKTITEEEYGDPRRGRASDEEAQYVRENLVKVNERLAAAGKRLVDPENPEHAKRFGFDGSRGASPIEQPQVLELVKNEEET